MPRKSTLTSDLVAIGLFAPVVVAARMQMLAQEIVSPTHKGQVELYKMTTEKPLAAMEAALAMQRSILDSSIEAWLSLAQGSPGAFYAAPALAMAAAVAPVRRQVRRNARRLRAARKA